MIRGNAGIAVNSDESGGDKESRGCAEGSVTLLTGRSFSLVGWPANGLVRLVYSFGER